MSEQDRRLEHERRLRQAALVATSRQAPEAPEGRDEPPPEESEDDSAALRLEQKTLWVDLQVRRAIERGEFDNLPGTGKPIPGLETAHDPDWWVRKKIEREHLTGLLPPALALRKEDAALDARLDRETTEAGVRRVVEDFNHRVVEARRQLLGGPPVITPTRDPDEELAAWRARRTERRERQRRQLEAITAAETGTAPSRWWSRWLPRRPRRPDAG
ncbi:MAG TPA: DUF1992 domain-containing protein [Nocardioidaceae bacterium]|nr:DUF1992 domain-containing protein [Nocardioidaceae bacterium]